MSGGLFTEMLLREIDREVTPALLEELHAHHVSAYINMLRWVRPLLGARALLEHLGGAGIPWAFATSGRMATAKYNLELLGLDAVAKPDPDLFIAAAQRLKCRGRVGSDCRRQ
jgi:phosphoglycolate phosphatase-like HAD superfamily hydrolase